MPSAYTSYAEGVITGKETRRHYATGNCCPVESTDSGGTWDALLEQGIRLSITKLMLEGEWDATRGRV